MITFIFLGFLALVAVFLAFFIIRGRSAQGQGKAPGHTQRKEDEQVAPKPKRASGLN